MCRCFVRLMLPCLFGFIVVLGFIGCFNLHLAFYRFGLCVHAFFQISRFSYSFVQFGGWKEKEITISISDTPKHMDF